MIEVFMIDVRLIGGFLKITQTQRIDDHIATSSDFIKCSLRVA